MNTPDTLPCPCGSGRTLQACCGRYHAGELAGQAPDAEALMRSRYSAFVLDRLDYLLASWHPDTRPASIEPNEPGLRWLGLEVKRHQRQDADHATVEFVARSKLGGRAHRLHEISRFERIDGRWYYLDGNLSPSR
ncbi:MAG: SEC-C domain-containing protein [Sphaerotilus natans subsp. sulfidivorans]|uniref:YchJ family protein n=1 Tax=Sphaerotilus sulfidivorans TaxID=639200 RepID=UPI002353356A|nr:YchJ family metal-binding protein [Sphaerotilus sulfidivorans]MCK6400676.1 SEC-C domain-containing protein [Sphaerotilus sulfidivorans]